MRGAALLRRYGRFLFAAAALGLLVLWVGAAPLAATLSRTEPVWLLLYLLAFASVPPLYGLEVWVALRLLDRRPAVGRTVAASVSAWAAGQLTPARSGDLSLAYFLGREAPASEVTAVVAADKVLSLSALALAACAASLFLGLASAVPLLLFTGAFLLSVLCLLLLLRSRWLLALAERRGEGRLGRLLRGALEGSGRLLERRPVLAWIGAVVVGRWLAICAFNLLLFRAIGYLPGFEYVVAATATGRIISLLPISIGGLGLKEPVQIVIYRLDGIPAEALVAVSLLGMAVALLLAALLPLLLPRPPAAGGGSPG